MEDEQQTVEQQPEAEEQAPKPPWGSDDEFDPDKAWKLIQNLRAEKEQLKPLAQKARELEESQKSEQEKLQERLASLEQDNKQATVETARLKVALSKGLSEVQARRLVGQTVEELEADADELLASFKPDEPGNRRPQERLRPGASPDAEPEPDPNKIADSILGRRW